MSCLTARTGRQRQRYEDQLRLVSGFEETVGSSNCNVEKNLLVLMISSPDRDDLVFPKGGWENDETMHEAACREALEEAGVKGVLGVGFSSLLGNRIVTPGRLNKSISYLLQETPLGQWEFRSKSKQNNGSLQGGCRGYMFALRVTEELDSWPEQAIYGRKWVTVEDAFKFCRYDWMREALRKLLIALSDNTENGPREELDGLPLRPVISEVGSEHQISSPSGCFASHSSVQQLAA